MPCTEQMYLPGSSREGFSITEMLVALSIVGMLATSLAFVISMGWNSYQYNLVSNQSLHHSGVAVSRIVNGYKGMWGLKQAEASSGFSVVTNQQGGWAAHYSLSSVSGMPALVTSYDPVRRELVNNVGGILAENVEEAYLYRSTDEQVHLGVRVASVAGVGEDTIIETSVKLRN